MSRQFGATRLILASAIVVATLGTIHLIWTFVGPHSRCARPQ
jgi:hypothetical protein